MKIRIGISRWIVKDDGMLRAQMAGDTLEIELPDDDTQFIDTIWMQSSDQVDLLRLPIMYMGILGNQTPEGPEKCEKHDEVGCAWCTPGPLIVE